MGAVAPLSLPRLSEDRGYVDPCAHLCTRNLGLKTGTGALSLSPVSSDLSVLCPRALCEECFLFCRW